MQNRAYSPRPARAPGRNAPPPRRRRRPPQRTRLPLIIVLLIVAGVLIYFLRAAFIIGLGTPKYYNVSVNGVSLKGYTRQEAQAVFDNLLSDWNSRSYTLTYGDHSWSFTAADFDASLSVNDLLDNA